MTNTTYASSSQRIRRSKATPLLDSFVELDQQPSQEASPKIAAGNPTCAESLLSAKKLCKNYHKGKHTIPVLRGVALAVRQGEFVAVVGRSVSDVDDRRSR